MYTDVLDLRDFYESSLGQVARRLIRRRVRLLWPDVRGQVVLGVGFATPYLRPFRDEAERVLAVMPAGQGVVAWPEDSLPGVALAEDGELPLPDLSVDRVLIAHGIEGTEHLPGLMREIWRVLAAGGRILAVVPNRRGIWARTDRTPFGNGHPYSASQLSQMLRDHMFVPERVERALFIPPLRSRFLLTTAPAWEEVGLRWFKRFAGVIVVEATKQVYLMARHRGRPARERAPVLVPAGGLVPAREAMPVSPAAPPP